MKKFTGWQWLLIDAANQFGKDKDLFEQRIQWATEHLERLEELIPDAEKKTRPQYAKAVMAIRKAQARKPTGHMVGVDACCSGIQVMSVLTGCVAGARSTGLIDPDRRADAYLSVSNEMNVILGGGFSIERKPAKDATMTSFYGSKKTPKDIFGEDTPELDAFYQAAHKVAPGAWELLQDLLASWQPWALGHAWKLPDGFDARVKVMVKKEARIEIDELNHGSFTYEFFENEGAARGLSNAANVTHSMDAYILREMHRRCNYDPDVLYMADQMIEMELIERSLGAKRQVECPEGKMGYYVQQYQRSTLASSVVIPELCDVSIKQLSQDHLEALAAIVAGMGTHQPFDLVTVHDEFKSHANNVDHVRSHYREILAEIADSYVLDDLLTQLHGRPCSFNKLSFNLGDQIRKSEYGLC